jgi:hypothetical protein
MESAYEKQCTKVLEFAFRILKSLDWHMFRFILHNVHMLDQKDERNGRFCPFLLSGTVYSKSEDTKKMSRYHSAPHTWQRMRDQPGGYGQDRSLILENMNGAFLNACREYRRYG